MTPLSEMSKRFWRKVDKTRRCWNWRGSVNLDGYGRFWIPEKGMTYPAHRWIYETINGTIISDVVVHHKCENRRCVNPRHLSAVSRAYNIGIGNGAAALNKKKTHCKHGHEFTPENTAVYMGRGKIERNCKKCNNRIKREQRKRRREEIKRIDGTGT